MTDVQTTPDAEAQDTERAEPVGPGANSTRRLVLLGAGAVGATAVLAACGTGSSSTSSNGSDFSTNPAPAGSAGAAKGGGAAATGSTADPAAGGGNALASTADVPQGGGIISGDYVITQPVSGTFKAFSKVCTHAGCDVSKIDSGVITCPCHNSKFSIETGEPVSGPATKGLPETKVKVNGTNIVAA